MRNKIKNKITNKKGTPITIQAAKKNLFPLLKEIYSAPIDLDILMAHVLKKGQEFLFSHPEALITSTQLMAMASLVKKRAKHLPIAYLTGLKDFYGYEFKVTPAVLIPRPETEMLVEEALAIIAANPKKKWRIIDVGSGSGAIIVALIRKAKENGWPVAKYTIVATEISAPALKIAKTNARLNNVNYIKFKKADLLKNIAGEFDVIIANLPYVPAVEYRQSPCWDIIKHEPKIAITASDDGLAAFKKLLAQAPQKLKQGHILLEHGYNQGSKIARIIKSAYPSAKIQIKKDLAKFDRVIVARV